jgi:polyisoprenyl-teichoic acid--peptidoglycan teichoic acid transferase
VTGATGGVLQAAPVRYPLATLPAGGTRAQQSPPASDFTPVTTTPGGEPITEAMLNELKSQGNEQAIRELVATNGQCAPL